jgi:hypothetical protein
MVGRLAGMTATLRVILEIGKKRRVVAGAMDWPGLDRWGTSEDSALDKVSSYLPRYAGVAERAGMGGPFARVRDAEVVERVTRIELDRLLGFRACVVTDRACGAVPDRPRAAARPPARLLGLLRRRRGTRLR